MNTIHLVELVLAIFAVAAFFFASIEQYARGVPVGLLCLSLIALVFVLGAG